MWYIKHTGQSVAKLDKIKILFSSTEFDHNSHSVTSRWLYIQGHNSH